MVVAIGYSESSGNIQAVPDDSNSEENKEKCREANVNSRKSVNQLELRTAKAPAYEYLYGKLDSRKRIKMVYRLAKTSGRRSKINIYIRYAFHQ